MTEEEVPNNIKKNAERLGREVNKSMDPLCEKHMRELQCHPTDDEFKNTQTYREFMSLVREFADTLDVNIEKNPTIKSNLVMELREFFDRGYYQPSDKIQCIGCLEDGEIQMRVSNPSDLWGEIDSYR